MKPRGTTILAGSLIALGLAGGLVWRENCIRVADRERTKVLECVFLGNVERATWAYFDDPPLIALGTLRSILEEIDNYVDDGYFSTQYLSFPMNSYVQDLSLMHGRLAKLYGQEGNTNDTNRHVAMALNLWLRLVPEGKWSPPSVTNRDELFHMIDEIDSGGNPYAHKL